MERLEYSHKTTDNVSSDFPKVGFNLWAEMNQTAAQNGTTQISQGREFKHIHINEAK
jgi:hypothetical protein